jgi:hypothetical protein
LDHGGTLDVKELKVELKVLEEKAQEAMDEKRQLLARAEMLRAKAGRLREAAAAADAAAAAEAAVASDAESKPLGLRLGDAILSRLSKLTRLPDVVAKWDAFATASSGGATAGVIGREAFRAKLAEEVHAPADEADALFDELLEEIGAASSASFKGTRLEIKGALKRLTEAATKANEAQAVRAKAAEAQHGEAYELQEAALAMTEEAPSPDEIEHDGNGNGSANHHLSA